MKRRVLAAALLVLTLVVAVPAATVAYRAQTGLRDAQELLAHQLWPQARERLASYLWLHPDDGQALLMMAEAYAKDEGLPAGTTALEAIRCLERIPSASPLAGSARLQEGRLYFLVLQRPGRAEERLRLAIEHGAGLPAWQMLWTVLNFTGRADEGQQVFWEVYELTPPAERPFRLRELYLNQFFPVSANEALDRLMGILKPGEGPSRMSESQRYLRFRQREPESPVGHAAVAQWCQQEGDPQFALKVLEAAERELSAAKTDRFFLSVSIATYLDLGLFDKADECFRRWPADDRSHAYWKWRAILDDDMHRQYERALEAYDRAIALWPGHSDWRLHHRKVSCLARLKRPQELAAAQARAAEVRDMMKVEGHERLRAALDSLANPQPLTELVDYYRKLGCTREAQAWEEHIRLLKPQARKSP
jgi:tetratricopeptide (TPR) repeat protein